MTKQVTETVSRGNRVGILGSGSWATALLKILTYNGYNVTWWIRQQDVIDYVRRYEHNPKYVSSVQIPLDRVDMTADLKQAVSASDVLLVAVPSFFLKGALAPLTPDDLRTKVIISGVKGLIPDDNRTISAFFQTEYNVQPDNFVVISGPCHAEEVANEKLSYLTFSASTHKLAKAVGDMFSCRFMKTDTTEDIAGCEFASVLKNVCALASGICHGAGYGDNFQAVLMAGAIREMHAFLQKVAPGNRDVFGNSYTGDLLATSYSQHSRNRTFGNMIGRGYSVRSAQMEMNMVAEGYHSVKALYEIKEKYSIKMPILEAVYNILYKRIAPSIEIRYLSDLLV